MMERLLSVVMGKGALSGRNKYLLMLALLATAAALVAAVNVAFGFTPVATETTTEDVEGLRFVGAALAVTGSCIGAGIAIYGTTSAGAAAMVERPELSIWILIFAGLGEGVAIYGLIVAILILGA